MGRVAAPFATFDCYGTLIDWNSGLRAALGSGELLERYHEVEPEVEAETPGMPYREVLAEVSRRIGAPDPDGVAESLPSWDPFPEVRPALERVRRDGWRLVILSNTDRDYIDVSMATIGVPFEFAIVASEIGSYKPALEHWRAFERETGRLPDVHVAASLFHDIGPASELGLKSIWVNRLGELPGPEPTREIPDLSALPEVLAEL
ncbi:MAG: HAD family hydrolase [Actinobacteria bacterium]|nr:HAD family hydrolase [Actinomycetota bacterium]